MNKISTLLTVGMLCFALCQTNAQTVTANFNTEVPSTSCWDNTAFSFNNTKHGNNPASGTAITKGIASGSLISPFIDIPANATISFDYLATDLDVAYTLTVRLISKTGSSVVSSLNITNTTYLSYTSPALTAGTYRVALDYSTTATNKFGQHYIDIDNLSIAGSYHYSNFCNTAPTSVADTYTDVSFSSPVVSGNVLANDTDPNITTNGEVLSVYSNTTSPFGTLVLNANGSFTFTPNASFTGGPVTFSYIATDNGYEPLTSSSTTVTINYPIAPQATNDNFTSATLVPVTNTVITNDIKPTDKTLIATVVSGPASGNLSWNTNGTFTYTPQAGFGGGDITFTYQVSYDTYMPLLSNTATVTINYPALVPTPLPIKLLSFTGALVNKMVQLNWSVDDNETGRYFKVEKSTDGRHFIEAATIFPSATSGKQNYTFTEPIQSDKGVYYRLQIANTDAPIAYSKTVLVKPLITTTGILTLLANPVQSTLRITITSDQQEQNTLNIYTINGTRVLTQPLSLVKGLNYLELDAAQLTKGMYIMEVIGKTTSLKTKFLK